MMEFIGGDIRQGDCLELMKGIPNQSIGMILCNLPYDTTRNKWVSVIPLDALWAEYRRIIKPRGEETNSCIVHSINNSIVADTDDTLLIVHRERVQDIRNIVSKLTALDSPSYREFPPMHRPWGTYTVLQKGVGFKLKRI